MGFRSIRHRVLLQRRRTRPCAEHGGVREPDNLVSAVFSRLGIDCRTVTLTQLTAYERWLEERRSGSTNCWLWNA